MLPYGRQTISDTDIAAVVDALRSDFLTSGPRVEEFERAFAAAVGAPHAVAVSSATAALHLAMRVLGIGPGHRVVTSPNTFVASANCAAFVGATPDFSDIHPATYNLDPATLEKNWKPDTKAVVAVDYAGRPCDMPEIARIARARGAFVVEDACHGVGGGFHHEGRDWKLGGHPWADITTFSFHPVKTMTTGEGGMLVTANAKWAQHARLLRSHGITRDPADFVGLDVETRGSRVEGESAVQLPSFVSPTLSPDPLHETPEDRLTHSPLNPRLPSTSRPSPSVSSVSSVRNASGIPVHPCPSVVAPPSLAERGPWYYEMQDLGYNYRITDIQCALGLSQLKRLPEFIHRRQQIVNQYNTAFANIPVLTTPSQQPTTNIHQRISPSWHLYTLLIDFPALRTTRTHFMADLRARGVGTQVLYIPVHLQPWYRKTYGYAPGKCPNAEAYYEKTLSLPLYPAMTGEDVERVINAVHSHCRCSL